MARLLSMALVAAAIFTNIKPVPAAEIVTLDAANWDEYAPRGKEVDCIYGDIVLRNDKIVAVIGKPEATRNANMTVKNVGGCIIDLTTREGQNDQLGAYYPGGGGFEYAYASSGASGGKVSTTSTEADGQLTLKASGQTVRLHVSAKAAKDKPQLDVVYELTDGEAFVKVKSVYRNPHPAAIKFDVEDRVRADRTFRSFIARRPINLALYDDEWFGQAYAIVPVKSVVSFGPEVKTKEGKPLPRLLQYIIGTSESVELAPEKNIELERAIFPAGNSMAATAQAARFAGKELASTLVIAQDASGPVVGALVSVEYEIKKFDNSIRVAYASGRTGKKGELAVDIPTDGRVSWHATVAAQGRGLQEISHDWKDGGKVDVVLPQPGYVAAAITDERGGPIPCKVQFRAKAPEGAAADANKSDAKKPDDPDFGPDSADTAVKNLYYSHNGKFRQAIAPGEYDVVISYGPEYDAVFTSIKVEHGQETPLVAKLVHVVKTPGWISTDFHSHSTPSGDNTSSQLGRVQNLLCEQIEFAPCTEHNRITTYVPHLKQMGVEHLLATCTGMELTGSLLPVNHQNAFPLVEKPRTQDGGGPTVDNENPVAQIERLAMWDNGSDKLVQMNHPDLQRILGDRDNDGKGDAGFENMFGYVDVMEIHPPHEIFTPPGSLADARKTPNTIFNWMQMLNLGYRIPGVVNTDAHYNFHGSGFLRNYVRSPTDDPAKVKTMDMVHASERGQVVVTNGPFLEVSLQPKESAANGATLAGPGDRIEVPKGEATLQVRVQCPNWFDIDRVQVFINGRPDAKLNFTRREQGKLFSRDVVRFDQTIPLTLSADAHIIVAAIGEQSRLGIVMGPDHGKDKPVAVSNPIFVDVDGDGFKANGDLLGLPIPHQEKPTQRKHAHEHEHE